MLVFIGLLSVKDCPAGFYLQDVRFYVLGFMCTKHPVYSFSEASQGVEANNFVSQCCHLLWANVIFVNCVIKWEVALRIESFLEYSPD